MVWAWPSIALRRNYTNPEIGASFPSRKEEESSTEQEKKKNAYLYFSPLPPHRSQQCKFRQFWMFGNLQDGNLPSPKQSWSVYYHGVFSTLFIQLTFYVLWR